MDASGDGGAMDIQLGVPIETGDNASPNNDEAHSQDGDVGACQRVCPGMD